jgi:hypothetical protein
VKTIAELNPPRADGFPKIVEISSMKKETKFVDRKDPNFDKPLSSLEIDYSKNN